MPLWNVARLTPDKIFRRVIVPAVSDETISKLTRYGIALVGGYSLSD